MSDKVYVQMRLKKRNNVKDEKISFRLSRTELNSIVAKAKTYCEGNISEWLIYAALKYVPSGDELEDEIKAPRVSPGRSKKRPKIVRN